MLIDKYTSLKEVIRNVYRDTGRDDSLNIEDAAYWVYECMEAIAFPLQYIPKILGTNGEEDYQFDAYKIKLPNDFHQLLAITVNGITAVPSSNIFHNMVNGNCCGFENLNNVVDGFFDNFGNFFSPQAGDRSRIDLGLQPLTFTINESYITFNIREGNVCLAYMAYPIDEEGFPMIPDNYYYKKACAAYIQERLDYIDVRKGLIDKDIYKKSERDLQFEIAKARNAVRMPTVEQMEGLKNQQIKMVVRIDEFRNNFRSLSERGYKGRY